MDLTNITNIVKSSSFLDLGKVASFAEKFESSILPTDFSSISSNQIFLIFGGLFLFRFFGGMFFSIFGLIGFIASSFTSIICMLASSIIRIFISSSASLIQLFSSITTLVLSSPINLCSKILRRWGYILVPIVASSIISSLNFHSYPFKAWLEKSDKSTWVSIDKSNNESGLDKF